MTDPSRPTKRELRRRFLDRREALDPAGRADHAQEIRRAVLALPEVREADSVFAYHAVGSEAATAELIADLIARGKTLALPRITDARRRVMEAAVIADHADAVPGHHDIPAPPDHARTLDQPEVILTPGLAFTARGDRLGVGGGYYDRYLAQHPASFTIGLCFDEQVAENLPTMPHDAPVHCLITPTRILRR